MLDLSVIGRRSRPHVHAYTFQDVALYALAVGAGQDELAYVCQTDAPRVLPTYAIVATLAPWGELLRALGGLDGVVHRHQRLRIHRELAPSGRLEAAAEIVDVVTRGELAEALGRAWVHDASGELLAETEFSVIYRNAGVQASQAGTQRRLRHRPPSRPSDLRFVEQTATNQALLYRLTGDINPIHVLPEAAARAGFRAPILHGLCTLGFVCRALMRYAAAQGFDGLHELEAEFRKPVYPGDALTIDAWRTPEANEVLLQVSSVQRPQEIALQGVRALMTRRGAP